MADDLSGLPAERNRRDVEAFLRHAAAAPVPAGAAAAGSLIFPLDVTARREPYAPSGHKALAEFAKKAGGELARLTSQIR